MEKQPNITAVLSIRIADTPLKGLIYILDHKNQKAAVCTCRGKNSEVFYSEEESEAYHSCRDWFMDNFDGFVQVSKLEGDEEFRAKRDFEDLKSLF